MSARQSFKSFIKPITMAAIAASFLSACVVSVDTDDDHYRDHHDSRISVRVTDGDREHFSCPKGYDTFVESDEQGAVTYGCRRNG